jgi:uncharacterized membrane protein
LEKVSNGITVFNYYITGFGIFFRFVSLDQKVYWIDEAFTSLRVSGYTEAEVVQQVSNAPLVSIEALQSTSALMLKKRSRYN